MTRIASNQQGKDCLLSLKRYSRTEMISNGLCIIFKQLYQLMINKNIKESEKKFGDRVRTRKIPDPSTALWISPCDWYVHITFNYTQKNN